MKESVRSLEAKKMEALQVWGACLRLSSPVFLTGGSTTSCPCVASLIMQNSISLVLLLGSEFTQLTHTSGCEEPIIWEYVIHLRGLFFYAAVCILSSKNLSCCVRKIQNGTCYVALRN